MKIFSEKNCLLYSFIVISLVYFSDCRLGIDLSTLASVDSFKCFLNSKYDFLNVRAWHSYGGLDINAETTI
jgi:hypothetical protein